MSRRPVEAARIAAKELRKTATRSENILWAALRSRRLAGRKFRRQHPIGQFLVDFCCLEDMLAVEIDGRSHDGREARDLERQRILEAMGLRFVRVSADAVERDLESVLDLIEASLAITKLPSPAHGRGAGGEGSC